MLESQFDFYHCNGEQEHYEANLDFQSNNNVQPSLVPSRADNGGPLMLHYSNAGEELLHGEDMPIDIAFYTLYDLGSRSLNSKVGL